MRRPAHCHQPRADRGPGKPEDPERDRTYQRRLRTALHEAPSWSSAQRTTATSIRESSARPGGEAFWSISSMILPCAILSCLLGSRGDLLISIATGGKSPALAKKLREELEELYGPEYGALLTILSRVREKVLVQGKAQTNNRDVFESILRSDIIEHVRKGEWEEVRKIIRELADVDVDMDEAEGEGRFNGCFLFQDCTGGLHGKHSGVPGVPRGQKGLDREGAGWISSPPFSCIPSISFSGS